MMSDVPSHRPGFAKSRYGFASIFLISLLLLSGILRVVLFWQFHPTRGISNRETLWVFWEGLHRDALVAVFLTIPLLLWFALAPQRWFASRIHRFGLACGLLVFWMVQVFLTFAEYYFFEEFRSRFNTVAVDYLFYPQEVFINIWDTYPVALVVALCAALGSIWLVVALRVFRGMWEKPVGVGIRWLAVGVALLIATALASTISLKEIHLSKERVLNEIANNGPLSFVTAFWTRNLDFTEFYKTLPKSEAYERARRLLVQPQSSFSEKGESIRRRIAGDTSRPRLNIVILLEESLGSEFWGSLGRKEPSLTPEMDRLAGEEGILFTNLYASGNRTVRGFEGVLSSFPPLPGDSIVKRDHSDNVETIARVLKRDGYSTIFLYGGRGVFDGMRSFAVRNGYDRFIEQKHFSSPTHTTIWGVCDEDLFARSIEEFRSLSQSGKPFLATVLSVSNHKPFTYPKGRIPEDPNERKRGNAVKYSDYALGKFFAAARHEAFWTNTIFVVVADHGARVYGSERIPIHSYEIPLLIAGPAVVSKPTRIASLGCSLDVAPTVLGLLGRPYETLFFGRDLLGTDSERGRVLINHNRDIGLFAEGRLIVFGLRKSIEFYGGEPKSEDLRLLPSPALRDEELAKEAISLFEVADDLYMHERYRLESDRNISSRAQD